MSDPPATAQPSRRPAAAPPRSIVLVGPLPPPPGGMANQTWQLARLLGAEGCDVTLVRSNAPYRPGWVGKIRGVRAVFRLLPYVWRLWRTIRRAELVHVMANSGWAWHLFAAPAVRMAAAHRVPVIVNYRGGGADAFLARRDRWVRSTLARASALVVPSEFLQRVFAAYGVAATIVPNIVDLGAFHPAPALPAEPHLLVTRNLEPIYDIGTALRAFAIVHAAHAGARLTVAGSGPQRGMLERLAHELGVDDRVRFTGRLDNTELPALYRSASIVVNASLVDNMPVSLLEAMASGVPIVSTDVGGVRHVVEDGKTALLVPAASPALMAAAVLRLVADRRLAARLRTAGLDVAPRYAWPSVRDALFGAYARACARGAGPSAHAAARKGSARSEA